MPKTKEEPKKEEEFIPAPTKPVEARLRGRKSKQHNKKWKFNNGMMVAILVEKKQKKFRYKKNKPKQD